MDESIKCPCCNNSEFWVFLGRIRCTCCLSEIILPTKHNQEYYFQEWDSLNQSWKDVVKLKLYGERK